jgi:hypothetical protein
LGERSCEGVVDAAFRLLDRLRGIERALRPGPAGFARLRCRPSRGFLGLLQAESEAMALGVERDDLQLQHLALMDHVAGVGDTLVG